MATFEVYLNRRYNDWSFEQTAENIAIGDRPIATIEVDDNGRPTHEQLNEVWLATQHDNAGEGGWTTNSDVRLCVRSLSIGDVIKTPDGIYFAVSRVGFQLIAPPEPCPHCGRTGGAR